MFGAHQIITVAKQRKGDAAVIGLDLAYAYGTVSVDKALEKYHRKFEAF